jgi:Tfp pilus assembly protein PilF
MHPCPSCGAPLDSEGICTSCGALARSFFRGLDLGAPQLARAVTRGLDFYRLLGVDPGAETRSIARRYRQLRVLFPDDPSDLAPEPARKLALLELAGRALTDPGLRQTYDALLAGETLDVRTEALRCSACAAPLAPGAARCPFCGVARPSEQALPSAPPAQTPDERPPAEPIDYYAMLGLSSQHLMQPPGRSVEPPGGQFGVRLLEAGPPRPADVDAAALARQREVLLAPSLPENDRMARADDYEIARRMLRDDGRRSQYDALLHDFRRGELSGGRLDTLRHLQDQVRAEIAEERGEQPSAEDGAAQLRQGLGYVQAGLPRDALGPLRRAVAALPRDPNAHMAYAQAILASDDPLSLGGHLLRAALHSLDASAELGGAPAPAVAALCRGLLARDDGDVALAAQELGRAVSLDRRLGAAWRGLAAVALAGGALAEALDHCRQALACDARDERALLMIVGACLRARRRHEAHEAAAQIAAIRGAGWTAKRVLDELMA